MFEQLTPTFILSIIGIYFAMLYMVSYFTSRKANNETFFLANRQSSWILVAIGMVGASLSGVTFISIPGVVGGNGYNKAFSYFQMVMGYVVGYAVIALVLLPLYYKMGLTSIYTFLKKRLGFYSYKMGAGYFLLSRIIGASFRLYLVAIVLQKFVMDSFGIRFEATVAITILLIWVYTHKGGIKTIIWTDTIQTVAMLTAVVLTIYAICDAMNLDVSAMLEKARQSHYTQVFFFENGWSDPNNFFKQFISGALIAIAMTGLDQDMMQKNLSCPNIRDAQKNVLTFVVVLVLANLVFLTLGAFLYVYVTDVGIAIPEKTDYLYPTVAINYLSPFIGITFVLGLIAAAYSSADSALTALTTSFCIDFLNFEERADDSETKKRLRLFVHIGFSLIIFATIRVFSKVGKDAVISELFKASTYTYGPILGLFAFAIMTRLNIRERGTLFAGRLTINWIVIICIGAPILSWIINKLMAEQFGFSFGYLILALNALLTFLGLIAISYRDLETKGYDDDDNSVEYGYD